MSVKQQRNDAEVTLLSYSQVLSELDSPSSKSSHLLLGNGFNLALGIATDYQSIFERMQEEEPIYAQIKDQVEKTSWNIEELISLLKQHVKEQENYTEFLEKHVKKQENYTEFLENYVEKKVKFDFMKATSSIARESVKHIYQENNQGIHLLLKHFNNYFTLNYDTFLYLLLMKFKTDEPAKTNQAVIFQNNAKHITEDTEQDHNELYDLVEHFFEKGTQTFDPHLESFEPSKADLKFMSKTSFTRSVVTYFKDKKSFKPKNIKQACDAVWKEKKEGYKSLKKVDDGFRNDLFQHHPLPQEQNLFFLHGSFHISIKKDRIKKLTQKQDKALYERLEEVISSDEESVVCVLAATHEEKEEQINGNAYLKKSFKALAELKGDMVILGSSLAENDSHIFKQINTSEIETIYISSSKKNKEQDFRRAVEHFPDKKIRLFDWETISWQPDTNKTTLNFNNTSDMPF